MKAIDNTQKKLIHIALAQLKMGDEEYRTILDGHYGVTSSKDLSFAQAHELIEYFKSLGFKIKGRKCGWCAPRIDRGRPADNVFFFISPGQARMINGLKEQVRWKSEDGYSRWLNKYYKIDVVRTSIQATRVIEGLKGLLRSQSNCRACGAFNIP
ncbi:MAG: regulatory protein GemA [Spirochaetaceae bacterium]|nr:regulatory protein GemA [Spirochaetaceae bacterium]